jgi:hypothetical protein
MTAERIAEIRRLCLMEVEAPANRKVIAELCDEVERLKVSEGLYAQFLREQLWQFISLEEWLEGNHERT